MIRLLRDKYFRRLLYFSFLAVGLYIWLSASFSILALPKLNSLDIYYNLAHFFKPLPKEFNNIVLVAIDDRSYELMGKRWPWDRSVYAAAIDKISSYKPKVISLDLAIVGQSRDPKEDVLYAETIKNAGNVIVGSYFTPKGEYIAPEKIFRDSLFGYGIINKPRDKDMAVRRARALYFSKQKEVLEFGFEIKTSCGFYGIPLSEIFYTGKEIVFKGSKAGKQDIHIPVMKDGAIAINYMVRPREFRAISFYDVIKSDFPVETFKDKIVLVGVTAEIFHDTYNTPFRIMPGVMINANEILTILSGRFIQELPNSYNYLILIIVVFLTIFFTYAFSPIKGLLLSLAEIVVFIGISCYVALNDRRIDYFSPILMVVLSYLGTNGYNYLRLMIEASTLKTLAITDGLTGLYVQRYFQVRMQSEFERAIRYGTNLSLIIMDLDHFKNVNDTYGHQEGNVVLKSAAEIFKNTSRKVDILVRYGGEEFCAILPNTPEIGACEYTERLRKAIENYKFPAQKEPLRITASFGVASLPKEGVASAEELVARVDTALYRAKNTGRNKVCVFNPDLDKSNLKTA